MADADPDQPGLIDRLRNRFGWFDRVMLAQGRYNDCKGDFYAADITYFTIFALFPLLMVGFSIGGFILANQPDLMIEVEDKIRSTVSGDFGAQLVELMDSAIESRGTVGIIGLATAAWAGLGWMNNLREALSQMWEQRHEPSGFVATKLSDLAALISAFLALTLTIGLTALSKKSAMSTVLGWFGLHDVPGLGVALQVASWFVSILISWMFFTWIIARLPRESVSFRSSLRAGLLAAIAFEIFKQVASIYLQSVLTGPAGATFGRVFTDDPAVVAEFDLYLKIAAWGYAGFGLLIVGNGIMNAVDKAAFALVQSVARVFMVMLPVALVLQPGMGSAAIFTAELANAMRQDSLRHNCPTCDKLTHEPNAAFCSRCGSQLFEPKQQDTAH